MLHESEQLSIGCFDNALLGSQFAICCYQHCLMHKMQHDVSRFMMLLHVDKLHAASQHTQRCPLYQYQVQCHLRHLVLIVMHFTDVLKFAEYKHFCVLGLCTGLRLKAASSFEAITLQGWPESGELLQQ